MKRKILKWIFIISLFTPYIGLQNRLFRMLMAGKSDADASLESTVQLVSKLNKIKEMMEAINRSDILKDLEKRILRTQLYIALGAYRSAWRELKDVKGDSQKVVKLKIILLVRLYEPENLLQLTQQHEVAKYLSNEEQKQLVINTFLRSGSEMGILISRALGMQKYTLLPAEIYNQIDDLKELRPNSSEYKQQFDILNEEFRKQKIAIQAGRESLFDISKDKHPMDKSDWKRLINCFYNGDRSNDLRELLIACLNSVRFTKEDQEQIHFIADEHFIDFASKDVMAALVKNKTFADLYSFFIFDNMSQAQTEEYFTNLLEASPLISKETISLHFAELLKSSNVIQIAEDELQKLENLVPESKLVKTIKYKSKVNKKLYDQMLDEIGKEEPKTRKAILNYLINYTFKKGLYSVCLPLLIEAKSISPKNIFVLNQLALVYHRVGNIRMRVKTLEELTRLPVIGKFIAADYSIAKDELQLLEKKWTWKPNDVVRVNRGDQVIHVLNKSLPEINGYTIRSKEIVNHQKKIGLNPVVITKLGWSAKKNKAGYEVLDGVRYYRLSHSTRDIQLNKVPMSAYFNFYAEEFSKTLMMLEPKLVHAASNFQNALPALMVASKLGVPTVYEVRGFWHDTTASKIPEFDHSERYYLQQEYELYCCNLADRVVAIGESLAEHLINLGVDPEKITIIPNGVDVDEFKPQKKEDRVIKEHDLNGKLVFGFIGSVTKYEGLDYFFKAYALYTKKYKDTHFLLVGDGPALQELRDLVQELNIESFVTFIGRVPHDQVKQYYSVIDVFPFPRINAKVCRLVTPLKPYEVMGMGKLPLVSDIPALREMVLNDRTGLIFKAENVQSLLECLEKSKDLAELGKSSREWVVENRNWSQLVHKYNNVYKFE